MSSVLETHTKSFLLLPFFVCFYSGNFQTYTEEEIIHKDLKTEKVDTWLKIKAFHVKNEERIFGFVLLPGLSLK